MRWCIRLAAAGAVSAVAVLAATGARSSAAVAGKSRTQAHGHGATVLSNSGTQIIGGSAAQRSLLKEIFVALGPTEVRQVRVVEAPGGVELHAAVQALRPTWELLVAGTAFFDRAADQHLSPVLAVDARQVGWPTTDAGNSPRPPGATRANVIATRRMIRRLALASGAAIAELRVAAPDALAVALRLRVRDAASFLQNRLRALVSKAQAHQARYDGLLIEVDDAHGVVWASGETQLGGEEYVRPALSGCNPFPIPGPTNWAYPTCPASG